tara:strand:+ start:124 stop:885 length:762 start_codon:yes stop_codon:yes gene_type:complete
MKKTIYLLLILIFSACKTSNLKKKEIIENGFLSYNLSTETNDKELEDEFSKVYDDAENKEDSILAKALFELTKKLKSDLLKKPEEINYYIIGDTIRVEDFKEETIYIPKSFKKFTKKTFRNKIYKSELNWWDLYKRWDTKYEIEIFKNEKKKILNIEGYKIILKENSIRTFDTYENIYEIYINDNYNIPLTYYDFLKIKNQDLNLKGLIIECKTYLKETPNLNNVYILKDFNLEKQRNSLIKINFNEYEKQNL